MVETAAATSEAAAEMEAKTSLLTEYWMVVAVTALCEALAFVIYTYDRSQISDPAGVNVYVRQG